MRQGCPDWLFLNDERVPYASGETHARDRADALVRVRDRLARQHIALLVVTVPDKGRVLVDERCDLFRPAAFADRLADFEQRLRAAGIAVVPTAAALAAVTTDKLGTGAFLRSDTHWSERGAHASAQAVADAVRAQGIQPTPVQHYDIKTLPADWRPGDLVRLAGIEWLPRRWQPGAERVLTHRFIASDGPATSNPTQATGAEPGAATEPPSDEDLFGDAQLPNIAVIGTSFSRTSNFIPYLEAALQTKVGNFARDGGDFAGAAQAYFGGRTFAETPPALVIWEIPERTLQMPWSADSLAFAAAK